MNIYAQPSRRRVELLEKTRGRRRTAKPSAFNPNYFTTDRYLQKGNFARLRDVTLSYSLPKSVLMKTKVVQNVNIYVTGHNLLTYRPYYKGDPEVGIGSAESDPGPLSNGYYSLFSYPNYRSWTAGVNVTF